MSSVKVVDSVPSMWLSMWLSGEACGYRDDMTCFRPCLCVACKRTFRQKRQLRGRSLNSAAGTAWWKNEQKIISDLFLKKKKKKKSIGGSLEKNVQKVSTKNLLWNHSPWTPKDPAKQWNRSSVLKQRTEEAKKWPQQIDYPQNPSFYRKFFQA